MKERKRIIKIIEDFHKEKFGCLIKNCIPPEGTEECYFKQLKEKVGK